MGKNTKHLLLINLALFISVLGLVFPTIYRNREIHYWFSWSSGFSIEFYYYFGRYDILSLINPLLLLLFPLDLISLVLVLREEYNIILVSRGWKELSHVIDKWKKIGFRILLFNSILILGYFVFYGVFGTGIYGLSMLTPFLYIRLAIGPLLIIGYAL